MKWLAVLLLLAAGPAAGEVQDAVLMAQRPPKTLAEFGFFEGDLPAKGVVPYVIASPLFSDYADKDRYIYTPSPVDPALQGVLDFPVGTAIIKTFRYGDHKVETRVLLHKTSGWKGYAYVWEGDTARLALAGADLQVQTPRGVVAYHVPNANQCKACHIGPDKAIIPIGPKLRNLNVAGQLAALVKAGVLAKMPEDASATPDYGDEAQPLEARARAYLDANCGHCHAPGHPADTSGLYLNLEEADPLRLGVMKRPVAAGKGSGHLEFDIVPGDPDASILLFRMISQDPGAMMPELGRSLVHDEGVALLRAYIAGLKE